MRRKQTTASRAAASPLPLKPIAARGSRVDGGAAHRAALSSVNLTGISASAKENASVLEPDSVDERQLLCAIHVLDDSAKSSKSHSGSGLDSVRAVQSALGFLIELTSSIDDGETSGDDSKADHASARPNKATICAARVLGSLKRFIAASKHICGPVDQSDYTTKDHEGHCCAHKCHQSLVRLAVLLVLFNLSRARQTAAAVVAEGLDGFLLEMAQGDTHPKTNDHRDHASFTDTKATESENEPREHDEAAADSSAEQRLEPLEADDLLLAVDSFDWCFESLSIDIARTASVAGAGSPSRRNSQYDDAVFLLPVGARTLRYLLDGVPLPTDGVQEHARRLERPPITCGRCSRSVKSPHKQKPQRLPSIFAFPSGNDDEDSAPSRSLCFSACRSQTSANKLTDRAWQVGLSTKARVHLALRSLVALALHLPERLPERRALAVRCRSQLHKIHKKYSQASFDPVGRRASLSSNGEEFPDDHEQVPELPGFLPHQAVAISTYALAQLTATAQLVVSRAGHKRRVRRRTNLREQ